MIRTDRGGITVAALIVVATVAFAAIVTAGAVAWRFAAYGELSAEATAYVLGLLGLAAGLIASTRPVPSDAPVLVEAAPYDDPPV